MGPLFGRSILYYGRKEWELMKHHIIRLHDAVLIGKGR
jgi:hypothetical protein